VKEFHGYVLELIHQAATRQRMTPNAKNQGQPRRLRTAYTNTQVNELKLNTWRWLQGEVVFHIRDFLFSQI